MASGIYMIVNSENKKRYIGCAVNLKGRFQEHLKALRKGKHQPYLQNAYNKYGEESFYLMVKEVIKDLDKLLKREQYWMDYYQSYKQDKGYNICPTAGSTRGRKLSEEHKHKIAKASLGKSHSIETRKKISEAQKGKPRKPVSIETRIKLSNSISNSWKNQEIRDKKIKASIGRKIKAESFFLKHSEKAIKQWSDPENKKIMVANMVKGRWPNSALNK
jgi:group I intron endonuclease